MHYDAGGPMEKCLSPMEKGLRWGRAELQLCLGSSGIEDEDILG